MTSPWAVPEALFAGRAAPPEGDAWRPPPVAPNLDAVDTAFPDLNCDRVEGGRWRVLRQEFEVLAESGFGQGSVSDLKRWSGAVVGLERIHRLSGWLHPTVSEDWVTGSSNVAALLTSNLTLRLACPLGVAAVVTATLVTHLVELHDYLIAGNDPELAESIRLKLESTSQVVQAGLRQAMRGIRFMLPVIAAVRWPILDMLAAAERHVLKAIHHGLLVGESLVQPKPDCEQGLTPEWGRLVSAVRRISVPDFSQNSGSVAYQAIAESEELTDLVKSVRVTLRNLPYNCVPLAMGFDVTNVFVCSEQAHTGQTGDPELCFERHDGRARMLVNDFKLYDWLLYMDWGTYPVLGAWRRVRQVLLHRLEVPVGSTAELAGIFGLTRARWSPNRLVSRAAAHGNGRSEWATFQAARTAFAVVERDPGLVVLTACWGRRHSKRLKLWLEGHRRAGILQRTLVMCHDVMALAACQSVHSEPRLCADVIDWPRSLISKLIGISMVLATGCDVLWLDGDAILLKHPSSFLQAMRYSSRPEFVAEKPHMLFSIEIDSWNCPNAGVFMMRATPEARRYMAFWVSTYLQRPHIIDQSVLSLLMGLIPGMDWKEFARTEGLFTDLGDSFIFGAPVRAQALGALVTPSWGSLHPQKHFVVTAKVVTGGIAYGHLSDVVVFHALESWPEYHVPARMYDDTPDVVGTLLRLLNASQRKVEMAWQLMGRSEHESSIPESLLRDCRSSVIHGR